MKYLEVQNQNKIAIQSKAVYEDFVTFDKLNLSNELYD